MDNSCYSKSRSAGAGVGSVRWLEVRLLMRPSLYRYLTMNCAGMGCFPESSMHPFQPSGGMNFKDWRYLRQRTVVPAIAILRIDASYHGSRHLIATFANYLHPNLNLYLAICGNFGRFGAWWSRRILE